MYVLTMREYIFGDGCVFYMISVQLWIQSFLSPLKILRPVIEKRRFLNVVRRESVITQAKKEEYF